MNKPPVLLANLYDGQTAQAHPAWVCIHASSIEVGLEGASDGVLYARQSVVLREGIPGACRVLDLPNGAHLELTDPHAKDTLHQLGFQPTWAERLGRQLPWAFGALGLGVALAVWIYLQGLPWLSTMIANQLPTHWVIQADQDMLATLDQQIFKPTTLSPAQQTHVTRLFQTLQAAAPQVKARLIFRSSPALGPNALALPAGTVVVLDDLVRGLNNDPALLGVLAHELGHVAHRHAVQQLVHKSMIGASMLLLVGDASVPIALVGTELLSTRYSRQAELEADGFAIAQFEAMNWPLTHLQTMHTQLAQLAGVAEGSGVWGYLSSHPSTAERIELIKKKIRSK